ncbi:hypothetical protein GCG54_00004246 [Colletotrichum gloeosporioides]|uniref:Ubiquitin 3 binding protein But2 C-terminal domain-containing protein n=1 Tax=Colletotrichum gloeosporioides TaxID=474922 RepID=A0A8H4FMQ9_COLGL|nr:uncharacterized protein GCG54_00004246 [Colletotrichum gloeosporioides]KAF3806614.1 hypothetical protein GCG54_00004246 [Colletotrichum gloeosporioides]
MARLSVVLTQLLSVAGSASLPSPTTTACARVEAPASLTWLLQDQPFEQEDPSSFFYVNQDIDATGNKANRVAQLVTFGSTSSIANEDAAPPTMTPCQLLFAMPEDSESWELIQREGAAELRVFRVPEAATLADVDNDAVRQKRNLVGAVKVKPGTQTIDLGRCDGGGGSFVFELADAGRSRVAFRQASKPGEGFGVFMGSGCAAPRREVPEDL